MTYSELQVMLEAPAFFSPTLSEYYRIKKKKKKEKKKKKKKRHAGRLGRFAYPTLFLFNKASSFDLKHGGATAGQCSSTASNAVHQGVHG
ncbi:hypothetical protein F2P79_008743 [Pimephales promelas]|nr:hypothetical protein F2P79_008743 [Pimephales promelas]